MKREVDIPLVDIPLYQVTTFDQNSHLFSNLKFLMMTSYSYFKVRISKYNLLRLLQGNVTFQQLLLPCQIIKNMFFSSYDFFSCFLLPFFYESQQDEIFCGDDVNLNCIQSQNFKLTSNHHDQLLHGTLKNCTQMVFSMFYNTK